MVFTDGIFDVLTPTDVRLFEFAKNFGKLTVGIYVGDNLLERNRLISSNKFVDDVYLIRGTLVQTLIDLKPQFYLRKNESRGQYSDINEVCSDLDIKMIYLTH